LKTFQALKLNAEKMKHNKLVIKNRLIQHKQNIKKQVFLGWEKQYKQWKIKKNKEDFDKAVKSEL